MKQLGWLESSQRWEFDLSQKLKTFWESGSGGGRTFFETSQASFPDILQSQLNGKQKGKNVGRDSNTNTDMVSVIAKSKKYQPPQKKHVKVIWLKSISLGAVTETPFLWDVSMSF